MKGFEKYQKTYFMPPEATYDWVKKDSYRQSRRYGAVWILEMVIRH